MFKIKSNPNNNPVTILESHKDYICVGIGTDAAVFHHKDSKEKVYKIFASDKLHKLESEFKVYRKLGKSAFFPTCFKKGEEYLELSFEKGNTLYDCLLEGIHIPKQVIVDVENAREYAKNKGLNPRDIHLKNILMYNGRAVLLDVSEYEKPGNDQRWELLKKGYEDYYQLIDGKEVPVWMMETVRKWYNRKQDKNFNELLKKIIKLVKTEEMKK